MKKTILTLWMIHQHPKILLGLKKRGFGKERWNGFGGHVESNETIEVAAKREVFEEAGVAVNNMEKMGMIHFGWASKPDHELEVHIFRTNVFEGEPTESEEMKPQWFHVDDIPYHAMWKDDVYWLPMLLAGKKFGGNFTFDDNDQIISHTLHAI